MPLINSIFSWVMKKRIHQIELFLKYPHEVQSEWLRKLISAAKDTEWGKKHDYNSITTLKKFRERVPVQDYESIKPYIIRLMQGEQNILWPSEIKWFSKSSGTTNDKSKFIPVSQEALEECHFKGGKDVLTIYCNNNPGTDMFSGKGLTLGGSHQINNFSNASYYGDLSAIIIQNLPFWAEFIRTPSRKISLMDKFESKIEKITEATIDENVTSLAGVPSWTLVLLNHILEKTGNSNILEIWPNLELFMHGGVNFTPYKKQFEKIIPSSEMNYLETYSASEGFFGIQDKQDSEELLLMLDYGVYYEFIPIKEIDKEHPETLSLDDVQLNTDYAIVITTNAGLWRYKIGDTVKFTSLYPFRIKITGRTVHFINVFGEELIIDNADKALSIACERTGAVMKEYTAAPIYMGDSGAGSHEWLIEFELRPHSIDSFRKELDNALKSLNSDYEAKRNGNLTLSEPVIKSMPHGTFYNWLKTKGKLGGQYKVPRLSNNRKIVEEILEMVQQYNNTTPLNGRFANLTG